MNFFRRFKKVFLVILFLALVFLIGYLIWRLFFQPVATSPTGTTTTEIGGNLPTAGPGGTTTEGESSQGGLPTIPGLQVPTGGEASPIATGGLTQTDVLKGSPTLGSTLSSDGQVQYYDQSDDKFYKVNSDGQAVLLSDKVFHDVSNIVWAPDKDQAILEYPDGSKIMYNFRTEKQITIPSHWEDFSFSPNSNQIVAKSIGLDVENRWLMVANSDSSGAKALEAIGTNADKVYPSWSPNNQIVAMYTKGVDFNRQEVYFVGLNDENFKSTVIEGRGLQSQWSTEGNRLLYSVYNTSDDLKPRLWIVTAEGDNIGQNRQSLDIATWASKCTFASNTEVYCAVPESLEKGAGLYPELADNTKDNLYKIDLKTGTKKLIAVPDGTYNISQIMVPENEDYLYFTDKKTGWLHKINL